MLLAIPSVFTIEADCMGRGGYERVAGDSYFAAAAVLGTFGWLGVGVAAVFARIVESSRVALLLPLAWFVVFVGGFLVVAAMIAPQVCPT